jgi:hypothetical protein
MKLVWLALLFSLLSHVNSQQLNKTLIEGNFGQITKNFIQIEKNLNKRMSSYGLQLMYCSANLKASKLPTNFTDTLENFMSDIKAVQYMDNHQVTDLSKMNMTHFDYAQVRALTLPTDIKLYSSIIKQLQTNGKMIQKYLRNITRFYMKDFRLMSNIRSKNKLMLNTIREGMFISMNIGSYIRLLKIRSVYLAKVSGLLNTLINNNTLIPPPNATLDSFIPNLKKVEDKLVVRQEVTKNASLNTLDKIAVAEKTEKMDNRTSGIMQSMKSQITTISQTDDIPKTKWPKFPDIPADATMIKLRAQMCESKEDTYKNIQDKNKINQEMLKKSREALLSLSAFSKVSSTSKKVKTSQAILDVIDAVIAIEVSYDAFKTGLNEALDEISQVKEVYVPTTTRTSTTQRYPVTIGTTKTTTTTSTLAPTTTTSTLAPTTTTSTLAPTTTTTTFDPSSYPCGKV